MLQLAAVPLGIHVHSDLYGAIRSTQGNVYAKNWIRPFKSHNGKLGYNFNKDLRLEVPVESTEDQY